jgi:hypothetical protein
MGEAYVKDVITELEEQLRYAQLADEAEKQYAAQLEEAIEILNNTNEEEEKMYSLTLEGLLQVGSSYYARNEADFMIIRVEGPTPEPEIIINPRENFDTKLAYYKNAYNEDLTLKAKPEIKISSYDFVTKEELPDYLV